MRSARLAGTVEVDGYLISVELVDGRFLVTTHDALYALDGDRLVRVLEADIIQAHHGRVLTPTHIASPDRRVEVPAHACGFVPVGDDDIVACAAALHRIGHVRWSTPLQHAPWELCISGDRLLVGCLPRQGMNHVCYGIDLATGGSVFEIGGGAHLAAGPEPGTFFVGGSGETRLVDRDGTVTMVWASHGIVVPCDPPMVLETIDDGVVSACHVTRLLPNGVVRAGVRLPGDFTSKTVVALDGSVLFWRDHALMRVSSDGEELERLLETEPDADATSYHLAGRAPGRLVLNHATGRSERLLLVDLA